MYVTNVFVHTQKIYIRKKFSFRSSFSSCYMFYDRSRQRYFFNVSFKKFLYFFTLGFMDSMRNNFHSWRFFLKKILWMFDNNFHLFYYSCLIFIENKKFFVTYIFKEYFIWNLGSTWMLFLKILMSDLTISMTWG